MADERPAWQRVLSLERVEDPGPEAPVFDVPEDRAHDPREDEEWFHRLPEHARQELREAWRTQEGQGRLQKVRRAETTKVYVYESAFAFAFLELCLMRATVPSLALAALFGAGAGRLCALVRATAPGYAVLFLLSFLLFGATAGSMHVAYYGLAGIIALCIGAALGCMHALQKFDGSEL